MKAIVIPYAYPQECTWAEEFFTRKSIAGLPVCAKPIIAYILDDLLRKGITETLILDRHFDFHLEKYLGDGMKWGMKIVYAGYSEFKSEADTRLHNSAFIGKDEVVFVLGNEIAGHRITSLREYYDLNMMLLEDQQDCVLPGYSAEPGVFVGTNVVIQRHADVTAPLCMGDDVNVGQDVSINRSILGNGCVIARGTKISKSIVFDNTYIGKNVELIEQIVDGHRIIDPLANAFVDLVDDGISEVVDIMDAVPNSFPATLDELQRHTYTATKDPDTEKLLSTTLTDIARDIAALNFPHLMGVYLGGGYGRGEGGAPLYNDLDFFPFIRGTKNKEEREKIHVALNALGLTYGMKLGIHVDFCRPKTRADFKKDEHRLMIQEFIRGNKPIYGDDSMLSFIKKYPQEALPAEEVLRTMVNRGMGLYLARDSQDQDFINRNINKAVLGSGDAILMAEQRYRWTFRERENELNSPEYSQAGAFKFRPVGKPCISFENALEYWQNAAERVIRLRGKEMRKRTLHSAMRYIYRRHRLGSIFQLGKDPLMRVFLALQQALAKDQKLPPEIINDWETFN